MERFYPLEKIFVDEVIIIWHGLGSGLINLVLPYYVKMDQKLDSGWKVQDTCCGSSMVMLKLKLMKVKTSDEVYVAENLNSHDGGDNHGTTVIK